MLNTRNCRRLSESETRMSRGDRLDMVEDIRAAMEEEVRIIFDKT